MNNTVMNHLEVLIDRHPRLNQCRETIVKAYDEMVSAYTNDHKLLIAGNGGSAADAEHMVGELMKKFMIDRKVSQDLKSALVAVDKQTGRLLSDKLEPGLMAIALVAHEALSTAFINDVDGYCVFAQQTLCYGREGDIFLGISTSGNSQNIMNAAVVARALGMKVIGLTGADGGELGRFADVAVKVPETETYLIQELHLPIYHCWCMMLEEHFFAEK